MLSEVQGAVCEQSCDKGNSFPFSLIGRNSNFGSIAHWLMGKSLNPSVLSCEGRILIFLARIMAGSYMLPIVTCQINAWYMKVCGGHLRGLCIYWWVEELLPSLSASWVCPPCGPLLTYFISHTTHLPFSILHLGISDLEVLPLLRQ